MRCSTERLAVIFVSAQPPHVLAPSSGCYGRRRPKQGDQIAIPASFDAKNAEATVRIMESDTFDQTG